MLLSVLMGLLLRLDLRWNMSEKWINKVLIRISARKRESLRLVLAIISHVYLFFRTVFFSLFSNQCSAYEDNNGN